MKKLIKSFFALTLLFGAFSCSSDDSSNSTSAEELLTTLGSGTWRITLYQEGDSNQTNHFTDYDFTFGEANVLTATNGSDTQVGFWDVDDDDSSSDVDLDIEFTTSANFSELTEDWDILERTSTKVRLRHVSGGNGTTDLLTFEKN